MKTTLTDFFLKGKKDYLMREIALELNEITHSKKLIKEIDNCLNFFFVDMCFSNLERKKTVTNDLPYMIEHWLAVTRMRSYLENHYPRDWVAISQVIESNLFEEIINAHYNYHHQEGI